MENTDEWPRKVEKLKDMKYDAIMNFDYSTIPDTDDREIYDDLMPKLFPCKHMGEHICTYGTDLHEIIGFSGTQNWDDKDMIHVLQRLDNTNMCESHYISDGEGMVGCVSRLTKLSIPYVNLMFCVANECGLIEYGTCLQNGWTTEKAKKVIVRRGSNLQRIQRYWKWKKEND